MTVRSAAITDSDFHAHMDGQLPRPRRREVEAALAANPDAQARLALWEKQKADLRAFLGPVAAEPVPLRLNVARLDGGHTARAAAWRRTALGFIGGFSLGIAMAGAIFLVLGAR